MSPLAVGPTFPGEFARKRGLRREGEGVDVFTRQTRKRSKATAGKAALKALVLSLFCVLFSFLLVFSPARRPLESADILVPRGTTPLKVHTAICRIRNIVLRAGFEETRRSLARWCGFLPSYWSRANSGILLLPLNRFQLITIINVAQQRVIYYCECDVVRIKWKFHSRAENITISERHCSCNVLSFQFLSVTVKTLGVAYLYALAMIWILNLCNYCKCTYVTLFSRNIFL